MQGVQEVGYRDTHDIASTCRLRRADKGEHQHRDPDEDER